MKKTSSEVERKELKKLSYIYYLCFSVNHEVKYVESERVRLGLWAQNRSQKSVLRSKEEVE